jgi:hypothetical protein
MSKLTRKIEALRAKAEANQPVTEEGAPVKYAMHQHLNKYKPHYAFVSSARGNPSLCNGDPVAVALASKTPEEVVTLAMRLLGRPELKEKYQHLNNGQQRMNCGNLLRTAVKKGAVKIEQL